MMRRGVGLTVGGEAVGGVQRPACGSADDSGALKE